jgi:hypothetical protein
MSPASGRVDEQSCGAESTWVLTVGGYGAAVAQVFDARASSAARSAIRCSSVTSRHRLVRRFPELRACPARSSSRNRSRTLASRTPVRVANASRLKPFSNSRSRSSSWPGTRSPERRVDAAFRLGDRHRLGDGPEPLPVSIDASPASRPVAAGRACSTWRPGRLQLPPQRPGPYPGSSSSPHL